MCPYSSDQPGWRVQGKVLPPEVHDWRRAGAADRWSLLVWQARLSPADLRRHGPWLARRQRYHVSTTDHFHCQWKQRSQRSSCDGVTCLFLPHADPLHPSLSRHNDNKTFLVWVNEEDHLRVISMQQGGNMREVFKRFCVGLLKVHIIKQDQRLKRSVDCCWNATLTLPFSSPRLKRSSRSTTTASCGTSISATSWPAPPTWVPACVAASTSSCTSWAHTPSLTRSSAGCVCRSVEQVLIDPFFSLYAW